MSRIAVIVSNPCTSDSRVIKMIDAARQAGHEVHVFATLGAGAAPYEIKEGVTYHRLEWKPSLMLMSTPLLAMLPRGLRRLTSPAVKYWSLYAKYRLFVDLFAAHVAAVRPDIIHAHDLICLPAGARAADAANAKLVYDAHELEVHRNPPLPWWRKRFVARLERRLGRRADAVITVGRKVGEVLGEHLDRRDIHVLYNAPQREAASNSLRGDLRLETHIPLLLYVGKVTMGRGVGELLNLLPKMPSVFFAAVGPSDARTEDRLRALAQHLGVAQRFRILPPVPHTQVVDYIRGATLGVISVEPVTLSYRYCMPNKLFELAFAEVPILSNELDEIKEFLAELGIGQTTDFEQPQALPLTLYQMIHEAHRYTPDAAARQRLEDHYSWDAQRAKLLALYARLHPTAPVA